MFSKHKILLIDDSLIVLEMLPLFLKTLTNKYLIEAYTSTKDVLDFEKIKETKYSAILLDYEIPFLNGYEYSKLLKENNINIPIIFITAHSDQKILQMLLNSNENVKCVLTKPFSKETILKELKKVTG